MNFALWCVLIAALLPYLAISLAKMDKSYLQHHGNPRDWEASLQGRQRRLHAAHLNGFEAFPFFAAGVILAYLAHAPAPLVNILAGIFIAARLIYLWAYAGDRPTLRSYVWMVGLAASIALCVLAGVS